MPGKKPNILLIMVDQLAPQFLSAYGHPLVKTPNIDRLCADGVVFDAAYTNAPLCAPARYVMMTGRLPSKIGAWDNAAELSSEVRSATAPHSAARCTSAAPTSCTASSSA
jgi:choline-sulfatase